jgi:hypothetical protein
VSAVTLGVVQHSPRVAPRVRPLLEKDLAVEVALSMVRYTERNETMSATPARTRRRWSRSCAGAMKVGTTRGIKGSEMIVGNEP